MSPHRNKLCFNPPGVKALIFVGLERVQNLEDLMQIEFGRGFTYNRPLRVNLLDLDYELAEQLVSNVWLLHFYIGEALQTLWVRFATDVGQSSSFDFHQPGFHLTWSTLLSLFIY